MNRIEFLRELDNRLMNLPYEEREAALKYYDEFFFDAGFENEQAVIEQLGSPEKVAQTIFEDAAAGGQRSAQSNASASSQAYAAPGYVPPQGYAAAQAVPVVPVVPVQNKSRFPVWAVVLILIFAIPVGIPLVSAIFGIFVGILGVLFGLSVALIAVVASLLIAGIATFIGGIALLFTAPLAGMLTAGVGLILSGVGLLLVIPTVLFYAKAFPAIIRGFVNFCKMPFQKRGANV